MTLQLREGAYYRNGHGAVAGPARPRPHDPAYPWQVGSDTYTASGGYTDEGPLLDDLIEEVVVLPLIPTEQLLADLETGYDRKSYDMASPTPTEPPGEGPWFAGYWNMVFNHRQRSLKDA